MKTNNGGYMDKILSAKELRAISQKRQKEEDRWYAKETKQIVAKYLEYLSSDWGLMGQIAHAAQDGKQSFETEISADYEEATEATLKAAEKELRKRGFKCSHSRRDANANVIPRELHIYYILTIRW